MKERLFKGKNIIDFPKSYVILDIETTGLDFEYCDIIEIAAIKYLDGVEIDRFLSLVQPHPYTCIDENDNITVEYVDEFITSLTGITNDMLKEAPLPQDVIPKFMNFIGDNTIIGYNVNFDINFLYDAASKFELVLRNNYVDILRMARKLYPDMEHHRLKDMIKKFHININSEHRAMDDVIAEVECLNKILEDIDNGPGRDEFINSFRRKSYTNYKDFIDGLVSPNDVDNANPFYGKTVVFTGQLSSMSRKDALTIVSNLGGIPSNSVTSKTNFLVVGNEEFVSSVKNGKTIKMLKANALKAKGKDIETISENTFLQMVNDCI